MSSWDNWKRSVKRFIHVGLRKPRPEEFLIYLAAHSSPRVHAALRKVAPQPSDYDAGDVRVAIRYGMRWHLYPSQYFQWSQYFGVADAVLDTLCRVVRPGDRVFDIGANIGFYSAVVAAKVGPAGAVHSFEPSPRTFARLLAHVRDNDLQNVRCYDFALGDTDQDSRLTDFGGSDSGKSSLRSTNAGEVTAGVDVHVRSFDGLFAQMDESRVDLLKVDVEGYEPEVLLGAADAIRKFQPILCVEWSPAWHGGREAKAVQALALLRAENYRCFEISSAPETHGALVPVDWDALQERNLLFVPPGAEERLAPALAYVPKGGVRTPPARQP